MSETNTTNTESVTIPFPSKWDESNPGAVDFYNKCLKYIDKTDDLYEYASVSVVFIVFAILIILFIFVVNVWLLTYHQTYIFKRQCINYYICLLIGSLQILIDDLLREIFTENYPCYVHHILTAVGYPTYLGSIVFIIIKYYKYYYKTQIAYFNSFLGALDEKQSESMNKKFIFKYYYLKSIPVKVLFSLFIFNFVSIIYSVVIYFVDERVRGNGFCGIRLSYLPQILEFVYIILIFFPLAFIEALKFDDKFKMKRTILKLILVHIFFIFGFFIFSLDPRINCSVVVEYTPPGIFIFLSCATCTGYFSLSMLRDIRYLNKRNQDLKVNYKAMIDMLEDKLLFREFGEFCRNENCIENILFYQEYWKFKKLFNRNERSYSISNRGSLKSQEIPETENTSFKTSRENSIAKPSIISRFSERANSIIGTTSLMGSTILSEGKEKVDIKAFYSTVEREATKFYDSFIASNSIYEINIQNYIIKEINEKMRKLKEDEQSSIGKIDEGPDKTLEEKVDIYYTLFDKAYKEVTDNIYLNSYSNYVHQKSKELKAKSSKTVLKK